MEKAHGGHWLLKKIDYLCRRDLVQLFLSDRLLVAGWLVGMMLGRGYGIAGDIVLGIIGGLVGGSLASILFVVSGAANGASTIAAIIAFTCAAILLVIKRGVAHPSRSSA